MYSVCARDLLHPSLCAYIESGAADAIGFDKKRKTYNFKRPDGHTMLYGGLVSKLKQLYYPRYKHTKRRTQTQKKGSNAELGTRIDNEIMMVTASKEYPPGKRKKIKRFHKMTARIIKEVVEERGHVLQCSQLPVKVEPLSRITQVDFITLDPATGRLHMWELKTGYTPGMYTTKGKGTFQGKQLAGIQCTKYGIWELQRYWTERALREAGIDVAQSNVINIYEDTKKGHLVCKILDNLPWVYNLDACGSTTVEKEGDTLKRKRA